LRATANLLAAGRRRRLGVSIVGFVKVADAMLDQGIV